MSSMMRKLSHPFIAELKRYVANQNATLGPIVMSLSELIKVKISEKCQQNEENIRIKQRKLSEVTDMIHAAHVFHRCVRDNSCDNATPTAKRLHQDNIMSLLVGDYLLAQSSVDMADLRFPRTVGLIAQGLEDYTRGEFLKLQLFDSYEKKQISLAELGTGIKRYAELTCGSLLSNACLSVALLAGYPDKTTKPQGLSNLMFDFGFHTGSAHRLIEILYCPDTNSESDKILIDTLDVSQFKDSIRNHIEKSVNLLFNLPDGPKRASLLAMLKDIEGRC